LEIVFHHFSIPIFYQFASAQTSLLEYGDRFAFSSFQGGPGQPSKSATCIKGHTNAAKKEKKKEKEKEKEKKERGKERETKRNKMKCKKPLFRGGAPEIDPGSWKRREGG